MVTLNCQTSLWRPLISCPSLCHPQIKLQSSNHSLAAIAPSCRNKLSSHPVLLIRPTTMYISKLAKQARIYQRILGFRANEAITEHGGQWIYVDITASVLNDGP